jgi:tRNA(adenine34) deaminase
MEKDAHSGYMRAALKYARRAAKLGEVPVGCVIVRNGEIVSYGYNRRERDKNALRHAEIIAVDRACRRLGGWRLWECEMYVTLEPCPMCAGAILNARIRTVYYGASDPKAGALGSVFNLFELPLNHRPEIVRGVLENECSTLIKEFFIKLRNKA